MVRFGLAVSVCLLIGVSFAEEFDLPDRPPEDEVSQRLRMLEEEVTRLKQSQAVPHETLPTHALFEADPQVPRDDGVGHSAFEQALKDEVPRFKYPNIEVHGVIQADTAWFGQDQESLNTVGDIQDGASFRRARLSANGAVAENVNYFLQMDFAAFGRPTFTDLWMEVTNVPWLGNVRVGQWKQPFSLEVVSSFRYTTFAERSLLFQSFTPFRHLAVGFWNYSPDERATWAASVYRAGQDQFGGSLADNGGYATVGRITYLPYYECEGTSYLHLGLANNIVFPQNRTTRFRTIPEYFVGDVVGGPVGTSGQAVPLAQNGTPFFVDTTSFGVNHYHLAGTELLWVEGPISVQSEFMILNAKGTNDVRETFHGVYVQAGYFLTGEHRPYNRKQGAVDRVKPFRNLLVRAEDGTRGLGAWELATRFSHLDLNDETIFGGELSDWTIGLNWYLNPYSKLQFNWIRAFLRDPFVGASETDIYGLRAQVEF